MKITQVGHILSKLFLAFMAFPPIYIVVKYLRWCNRLEKESEERADNE
ncbi:MAG: hypothetical protein K2X77_04585 [Candidatus Obscuribacterales bacterium]|jgi:hypothetical protein|nr:hypothetical protein [Candidatus Obscuribacterales bacterium]